MVLTRRQTLGTLIGSALYTAFYPFVGQANETEKVPSGNPTTCNYAPPGEYIKDHTLVFHDGWWHLFAISGTQGYYHGYNGNEETFSWSISKNLVDWEFRGHVMHPSLRKGTFDQHEVWAPYCIKANGRFYMFYTGIIHPHRPLEYRKLGHDHPWVAEGHKETQGLAISDDLTDWVKTGNPETGLGIPGRDSYVVRDEPENRWLLYSTGQGTQIDGKPVDTVLVSRSADLLHWDYIGVCAVFPKLNPDRNYGYTVESWKIMKSWTGTTESISVMKHPITQKWILMGNWQYVISDNPIDFKTGEVKYYDHTLDGKIIDMGFACEMIQQNNKWYRSGVMGERDHWRLGFTEIEWVRNGAFQIIQPSMITNKA
ncbi:MAG: family 43 glycosylhydrolase [Mariniphaga sp.]|nr:family 43 glycosylhydrolase [Mariniphaga sp.]MDD4226078.1 family 43 glycosylhydrolase [Mariniphaga sp.]